MRAAETKGTLDFILYGDSITAYHFGYQIGYKPPASDKVWKTHFGTLNAVPLAIPGDQIGQVWYRMAKGGEVPKTPPKVIGLFIGINDCIRFGEDTTKPRVPPSSARMDLLLNWIRSALPTTEVILCALAPVSKTPTITKERNALNASYKALVAKHAAAGMRVVYVDCGASFTASSGAPNATGYSSDGIHLAAKGHEAFLKTLRSAVNAALTRASSATPNTSSASTLTSYVSAPVSTSTSASSTYAMLVIVACIVCCASSLSMMGLAR